MEESDAQLENLQIGDIIQGETLAGAKMLCIITEIDAISIKTRRLLLPETVIFNTVNGKEIGIQANSCIVSIAPLPRDIRETMIELDQRHNSGKSDPNSAKLTEKEKAAFKFKTKYYNDNPYHPKTDSARQNATVDATTTRQLKTGDIIQAEKANGGIRVCIILSIQNDVITTDRLLVRERITFNLKTGQEISNTTNSYLFSTAPLPPDIRRTIIELDDRHHSKELGLDAVKLTSAEIKALVYLDQHHERYRIAQKLEQ